MCNFKVVAPRVFEASYKTPWHLRGSWERRLIAREIPWHLVLEKEGLVEAPWVLECKLSWHLLSAWEEGFVSTRFLSIWYLWRRPWVVYKLNKLFVIVKLWTWWVRRDDELVGNLFKNLFASSLFLLSPVCLCSFEYSLACTLA